MISRRPPPPAVGVVTDQWTRPFWQAARQHRLVAPRCADCGHFRMPPTPFCPRCRRQHIDWVPLSGIGTVYSYTVVLRAVLPAMEAFLPYVPAVIALPDADGVRLISNIVEAPLERIRIGVAVSVVWDDAVGGDVLPRFALSGPTLEGQAGHV